MYILHGQLRHMKTHICMHTATRRIATPLNFSFSCEPMSATKNLPTFLLPQSLHSAFVFACAWHTLQKYFGELPMLRKDCKTDLPELIIKTLNSMIWKRQERANTVKKTQYTLLCFSVYNIVLVPI